MQIKFSNSLKQGALLDNNKDFYRKILKDFNRRK